MHRRGGKVTLMNPSACGSPSLSEKKKAQKQDSDRIAHPAYHDLYQQLRDEHSPTLTPENMADLLESFRATFESKETSPSYPVGSSPPKDFNEIRIDAWRYSCPPACFYSRS